ncbi:hypothetical protein BABINDRAFT_36796 [Babjeviella inositovora NRRL Y-12698]|uniref:Cyclin-like domain-containing protein n=1 Tax=Babjeviella inositovora NRRL Y-12698 TaxID=984486 RepID=A0A1E3QQN2_9ASCO|nr:uncharacterized protein BABINDRAFT_36796 [Babjeviella inositovora NRRL Y-12698]ODQ79991.1 hypothetical protein BABINDRAFT_36796 [Babjeviella inositovora NRRL Y-12698]
MTKTPDPEIKVTKVPKTTSTSVRISADDLYRQSTQFRYWSYRKQDLDKLRVQINDVGAEMTAQNIANALKSEEFKEQYVPGSIEPLTPDEENAIVTFYARKIPNTGQFFQMNSQIKATGIAFFRRFYLVNSVMEFHPKLILHTCLYLASKSENHFISINSYSKRIPKSTPESLLRFEFDITTALQFSLMCHHPYKAMYGFYLDIQTYISDVDHDRLNKCYDKGKGFINELLFSDTQFLFSPPHIALSCLWEADNELISRYLKRRFGGNEKKTKTTAPENDKEDEVNGEKDEAAESEAAKVREVTFDDMRRIIKQCSTIIKRALNPTITDARAIDKKLHYCMHPEKTLKRKREDTGTPDPANVKAKMESTQAQDPNQV